MFVVVLKLPPKKIRYTLAVLALFFALLVAFLLHGRSVATNAAAEGTTITLCLDCLHDFGWEVDPHFVETKIFLLSPKLSDSYLALQDEAGFDLRDDTGKQVIRYTFRVTNYPTGESGVLADVLIREGQVVGGDIRTSDIHGFMHSLLKPA